MPVNNGTISDDDRYKVGTLLKRVESLRVECKVFIVQYFVYGTRDIPFLAEADFLAPLPDEYLVVFRIELLKLIYA